ncbi:Transposon Ty3-G Gag-Pol polyprotein [Pelomyxa schiedti]|nr:Transposon Ty3-G Gag-Pol polyprotein [Pelomyxa schiedti]
MKLCRPVCRPEKVMSPKEKEMVGEEIDTMLRLGVIKEGASEWVAPLSLSTKKDGSMRLCTNFRGLNRETLKDNYPLPNVFEVLKSLNGHCWFSTLDLMAGFWQVPVAKEDVHKTGFVCHRGLLGKVCAVYIDDIIVMGHTFEEHLQNLRAVYTRLRGAKLRVRALKCSLVNREVSYLGHMVSERGVQMDAGRIKVITGWPRPRQWTGELETFVNMVNYYARFVPDFAIVAAPLRELGVKGAPWVWDERCEEAFTHIKHLIAKKLLLESPDYSSEFRLEIHTDASKVGMGAALVQMDAKGAEHIIELASRVTTPHEKKYDTVCELEAAAVVWALKKFRSYIHGVGCVVKTDNKALTWMQNQEHPCARVARWQMLLDDYGAVVEFRPGKQSGDVDAISRMPQVFVG